MTDVSSMMETMITGALPEEEIEAFLLELRRKGETAQDILAAAKVMRKHAVKLSREYPGVLDTCGTGGDCRNTFNVSTIAAIVACAASTSVAKHGNRAVSGICGSADLLEMLGMRIDLPVEKTERMIEKTGFGFFFAPLFHPATKTAMPARKRIQGKTIFNVLGPLTNPAGAKHQLMGVYEPRLVLLVAEVLLGLGVKRAMVVHGEDGMDEISLTGKTMVAEVHNGTVHSYTLTPDDFGMKRCSLAGLQCSSKEESLQAALDVLGGVWSAKMEIVCLNAGAAIYAAERAISIREGIAMARRTLENGAALKKLNEIVEFSK